MIKIANNDIICQNNKDLDFIHLLIDILVHLETN